jgi:hypothetical protein
LRYSALSAVKRKNINQSKEEINLLLQTVLREALEEKESVTVTK